MPELPILSGAKVVAILQQVGYQVARQRGSHMRLRCNGKSPVTVPAYSTISRGLLRKILRDAELTPQQFLDLMR